MISVPQNKVKQKNPGYRLKTGFSMETHVPLGQVPLKILTPAPMAFVLLNSAPKSPKISSSALRKAHPAVCIQAFSTLIQPTLSQIISNSTNKNKDRTFSTTANCLSGFRFSNRKCTRFYTLARNTVTILADKVLASFLLV